MSEANAETTKQLKSVDVLWKSRWAVRLFVGLTFLFSVGSLLLFAFQSRASDPMTGEMLHEQRGAWLQISSHLIRAGLAGWLMLRAWRYLREVKLAHADSSHADFRPLFAAIARALNAVGWSCLILISLGILGLIDVAYGLPSIPLPQQSMRMAPHIKQRDVKIELREAQFEPHEGWNEGFMVVVEPVKKPVYLRDSVIVDQGDIIEAKPTVDSSGAPALALNLSKEGAEKMQAWSTENVDHHMAIIVDGIVIQVPIVRSPIGGSLMMTGRMSPERVQEIANSINGKK